MIQSQATDWHHVWLCLKSFFEFLYFVAGVTICGAAIYAAKQVKIASEQLKTTKEIADRSARREAVKLASDHCRYYAGQVLPAFDALVKKYREHGCTFLDPVPFPAGQQPPPPQFIIQNGDFGPVTYDLNRITAEQWNTVQIEIVYCANKLESFAIPFAAGAADDAIGFQETAPAFIALLNNLIPAIYYLRRTQGARYASILKLFNVWNNRVAANVLGPLLQGMQKIVADANNNPIQPL